MATIYRGWAVGLTIYEGDTAVADGTISGYVKSIDAYVMVDSSRNSAQGRVIIDLTPPDQAKLANLVSYNSLDEAWATKKIENYLDANPGNVKGWLDNQLSRAGIAPTAEILQDDLPWG